MDHPKREFILKNQYDAVDRPVDLKVVIDRPALESIIGLIQTARKVLKQTLDDAAVSRARYTLPSRSGFRVTAFRDARWRSLGWKERDVLDNYAHLVDLVVYHTVSGYASIYFVIYNLDRPTETEYMVGQCSVSLYKLKKIRQQLLDLERGILASAT